MQPFSDSTTIESMVHNISQAQYCKAGVKIVAPRGIETQYKFVLPPFVSFPSSRLRHGVHFFHSLSELREAYPDVESIEGINPHASKFQMNDEPTRYGTMKHKRMKKRNRKYESSGESSDEGEEEEKTAGSHSQSNTGTAELLPCGGCKRLVGGAHKCPQCSAHMHPFCGVKIGAEGYGQQILCPSCAKKSAAERLARAPRFEQLSATSASRSKASATKSSASKSKPSVTKSSASKTLLSRKKTMEIVQKKLSARRKAFMEQVSDLEKKQVAFNPFEEEKDGKSWISFYKMKLQEEALVFGSLRGIKASEGFFEIRWTRSKEVGGKTVVISRAKAEEGMRRFLKEVSKTPTEEVLDVARLQQIDGYQPPMDEPTRITGP